MQVVGLIFCTYKMPLTAHRHVHTTRTRKDFSWHISQMQVEIAQIISDVEIKV